MPAPPRGGASAAAGPATQRGPGAYGAPEFVNKAARPGPAAELLSPRTIELVQWSWAKVMPISDAAAALFYERLFTLDPSVRPLFKNDIAEQKKKLMQTLAVAVDGLNNLGKLVPVLQSLGVRHHGYMVAEHHYDVVGEALLWTLREGLGDAFSSDIETAWKEVYGVIADVMKKAAAAHAAVGSTQVLPPTAPALGAGAARANAPAPARSPSPRPNAAEPAQRPKSVPPPSSAKMAARTLVGVMPPWQQSEPPPPQPQPAAGLGAPISPRTIELVQRSWAKVMPISDAAAALFYDRLFELDPSVRPMFKNDMAEQKKKLMQTLAVAVDGLNNLGKLVPVLKSLGARHHGYMVVDRHYDVVGEALLWTLREGLGDGYNSDVEAAWTEVYGLIADVMKKAAAEHVAGAPAGKADGKADAAPAREQRAPAQRPPLSDPIPPQSVTEVMKPRRRPSAIDEDADTLHYQTNPAHEALLNAAAEEPRRDSDWSPRAGAGASAAPAPAPAPAAPQGIVIPWAGQEMVVNVHVKLDSPLVTVPAAAPAAAPAPVAAPAALEPTGPSGLVAGLAIALLSIAASMATAILLTVGAADRAAPGTAAAAADRAASLNVASLATYAVPIIVTVLVLSAFTMGHILGRGRSRGAADPR
ncbi:globin family protein [Sorangium cellulosum]|uniref:globin family protein n=1 Tax=Sorangium cellulosum TaxID=56 RepID=UPI001F38A894|nr:globin family protein [Sorangium cellulosum]